MKSTSKRTAGTDNNPARLPAGLRKALAECTGTVTLMRPGLGEKMWSIFDSARPVWERRVSDAVVDRMFDLDMVDDADYGTWTIKSIWVHLCRA